MEDCIFCKIIAGKIPSNKIYEDDQVFAFLDNNPITEGHTLVIPKLHIKDIHELNNTELTGKLMETTKKIANQLKDNLHYKGVMIMELNGEPQEVPHLHFHVFGRDQEHPIKLLRPEKPDSNQEQLQILASKIFIND
jgi:histidine triad (HIT) family protein